MTPIRLVPARAGSDRKTIMAVDLRTFDRARTAPPVILRGHGLDALANDPAGVLIAPEIEDLFGLQVGDLLGVMQTRLDGPCRRILDTTVHGRSEA